MKVPFYLNFEDFENSYYDNLEQWFETNMNSSETDFLLYMKNMYKEYVCYSFSEDKLVPDATIEIRNLAFPEYENFGLSFGFVTNTQFNPVSEVKIISMMEYAQIILDRIHLYFCQNKIIKENDSVLNYINHHTIIGIPEKTGFCMDYANHQRKLPFLEAFLPKTGNTVDISLYRTFYLSVTDIADFIDYKLKEVQAFEQSMYYELKSNALVKFHMKNQTYLTICN
ncbi:hypothetical protein [Chryseobacterium echinoideorum]|uniref:hypothetical protein n=1 Tax=Chryseobacterium echinoideorum TaxID=1549648 RepID=UPI0011863FEC|nr:hypothetical protein [Chryseobacterium echinoideorum]